MHLLLRENILAVKAIDESTGTRRAAKGTACTLIMHTLNWDSKHTLNDLTNTCAPASEACRICSPRTRFIYRMLLVDAPASKEHPQDCNRTAVSGCVICIIHHLWQTWISCDGVSCSWYTGPLSLNCFLLLCPTPSSPLSPRSRN